MVKSFNFITKRKSFHILCIVSFLFLVTGHQEVFATSTGMPWESILDKLVQSLSGPVARMIIIIAICACGAGLIFGESGGFAKKMISICCGGAIIAAAVSWGPGFFNFSGACLMG